MISNEGQVLNEPRRSTGRRTEVLGCEDVPTALCAFGRPGFVVVNNGKRQKKRDGHWLRVMTTEKCRAVQEQKKLIIDSV